MLFCSRYITSQVPLEIMCLFKHEETAKLLLVVDRVLIYLEVFILKFSCLAVTLLKGAIETLTKKGIQNIGSYILSKRS